MHMQSYELEGLSQDNEGLTSSKSAVLEQLAQMNLMVNNIQA